MSILLHYVVQAAPAEAAVRERAITLLHTRYPELELGQCLASRHRDEPDLWLCRAPGEDGLRAWLDAAGVHLVSIRRLDPHDRGSAS